MVEITPRRISLLICTRNRRASLAQALESLVACRVPSGWSAELVVVDNGSTDGTSEAVAAAAPRLPFPSRCVTEPVAGLGRAHITGLRACTGELIACTDDDCRVTPEWCETVVAAFDARPELGGVFGRVLPLDGEGAEAHRVAFKTSEIPAVVQFPCWPLVGFGNNMAFRRVALESVGGFNAAFGPGGALWSAEELELSYRLLRRGWRLAYEPGVVVWHQARSTFEAWAQTHVRDAMGFGAFTGAYAIRGDLFALKLLAWEWQGMLAAWWRGARRGDAQRRQVGGRYVRALPLGFLAGAWHGLRRSPAPLPRQAAVMRAQELSATRPLCSVVICSRDRAELLRETLGSLLDGSRSSMSEYEVVVVDNGSRDQTRAVAAAYQQQHPARVAYVYEPRPGLSWARNAGLRAARGAIVAFTDDDCLASPHWVSQVDEILRQDHELSGVFGRVLPLQGTVTGAAVSVKTDEVARRYRFPCSPFIGHGNNMAFRREALRAIGGFDVALGAGGPLRAAEDLDVAYRLLRAGHTLAYDPRSVISHRPRGTTDEAQRTEWRNAIGLGACFGKHILGGDAYALRCVYWLLRGLPASALDELRRGQRSGASTRWLFFIGVPCGLLKGWWYALGQVVRPERRQEDAADERGAVAAIQRFTSAVPGGVVLKRALQDHPIGCGIALHLSTLRRRNTFTVLTYHRILDQEDPYYPLGYGMRRSVFEAQLQMVHRFCAVLSLDEIMDRLDRNQPLPPRCLALTFDDGYREMATVAWPLLKRFRVPATLFATIEALERGSLWPDRLRHAIRATREPRVVLETVPGGPREFSFASEAERLQAVHELDAALKRWSDEEKERVLDELIQKLLHVAPGKLALRDLMLSWEELRALAAEGCRIGSHTVSHPILARVSEERAQEEITASRRILQERLGVPAAHFAYPNGTVDDFSSRLEASVKDAGFRSALTTVCGINRSSDNRFALKRVNGATASVRSLVRVLEQQEASCHA